MDPELKKLLDAAVAAQARGMSMDTINLAITEETGGQYADLAALQQALAPPPPKPGVGETLAAGVRKAFSPSFIADEAKMLLQGATLRGGDDMRAAIRAIPSLMPGGETPREAFGRALKDENADIDRIRGEMGGAASALEVAGGLAPAALPARVAAAAVRTGGGLLNAAGRGAATGGIEGGLFGALDSQGSIGERAAAAVEPAAWGAGGGLLMGGAPAVVNALQRPAAGRGARVGAALQESAGVRVNPRAGRDAKAAIRQVREEQYQPLEAAFPAVPDPTLFTVLRSPRAIEATRKVSAEVADGTRAPSFTEVQDILGILKDDATAATRAGRGTEAQRASALLDEVKEEAMRAVPGFREANESFAAASATPRAFIRGRRSTSKGASDIADALDDLPPAARTEFVRGHLTEVVRRLEKRDESAATELRALMDAGPDTQQALRTLFGDEVKFRQFQTAIGREQSAEKVAVAIKRYLPWVAGGTGLGIGGEIGGLFR